LDFEPLLAGTVFREPRPATSAADRGFGRRPRRIHFVDLAMQRAARPATGFSTKSFSHSSDVLAVLMHSVTVQRGADAQKEFEGVAEIVSVIALKGIRATINRELGA
jgi:hypothetical protein